MFVEEISEPAIVVACLAGITTSMTSSVKSGEINAQMSTKTRMMHCTRVQTTIYSLSNSTDLTVPPKLIEQVQFTPIYYYFSRISPFFFFDSFWGVEPWNLHHFNPASIARNGGLSLSFG